jgi:hypothetical protein
MHARARAARTRAEVRRWNYRQRDLAAGVWFRLRRVLADARAAYVISEADGQQLMAEGYAVEPSGNQLAPEKTILFVDEARLSMVASRQPIPVELGPAFLGATTVALVAFEGIRR